MGKVVMRRVFLAICVSGAAVGCGDPVLPAGYSGPPASAVSGDVFAGASLQSRDAQMPNLALAWLPTLDAAGTLPLVDQPLSFARSARLQDDWDIGVGLPARTSTFYGQAGTRPVRMGVAKMIYFDDRNGDGKVNWTCQAAPSACDQVKAVSAEFVLYMESPLSSCHLGGTGSGRGGISAGYHYYGFDSGVLREMTAGEPLAFVLSDRSLADSNPTGDLRAFAAALLRSWGLDLQAGACN